MFTTTVRAVSALLAACILATGGPAPAVPAGHGTFRPAVSITDGNLSRALDLTNAR